MMKEKRLIKYFILFYWTFFATTSVIDKIIPDVYPLWVGADFYTLFIKLFASLGLKDPIFATIALTGVSLIEVIIFVCFSFSLVNLFMRKDNRSEQWFYRGILFSVLLFSFFTIGDQVFGDRFTLLEHSIFWIILIVSWVIFKYNSISGERTINFKLSKDIKVGLIIGTVLTLVTSFSIIDFSKNTYKRKTEPVKGEEVIQGIYKFDLPFLSDKKTFEKTIDAFEKEHPNLKINYIYTGPNELNTKKKTHMLLYVFTEKSNPLTADSHSKTNITSEFNKGVFEDIIYDDELLITFKKKDSTSISFHRESADSAWSSISFHSWPHEIFDIVDTINLSTYIKQIDICWEYVEKIAPIEIKRLGLLPPQHYPDILRNQINAFNIDDEWRKDTLNNNVKNKKTLMLGKTYKRTKDIMLKYNVYKPINDYLTKKGFHISRFALEKMSDISEQKQKEMAIENVILIPTPMSINIYIEKLN